MWADRQLFVDYPSDNSYFQLADECVEEFQVDGSIYQVDYA